jgi:dTDP-4-dehydrorhamnose reductase
MSMLVFGQSGQVARALGQHPETLCLSRTEADLTDPESCVRAIHTHAPSAVINAAAYTAVDRAEEDEATATIVNGVAPGAMARTCAAMGIPFVTISTDYVFDGSGAAPRAPDATTAPLSAYGRSKLAGEEAVTQAGGAWAVLRTSWVFAPAGKNFVTTMLRLAQTRDRLRVVGDQVGGPTPAYVIADACLRMVQALADEPGKSGIYHLSGAPDVSWAGFARAIFDKAGLPCIVEDIPTADYPTPAARPLNSRLDCQTLKDAFGIDRPDWRMALPTVIAQFEQETEE